MAWLCNVNDEKKIEREMNSKALETIVWAECGVCDVSFELITINF